MFRFLNGLNKNIYLIHNKFFYSRYFKYKTFLQMVVFFLWVAKLLLYFRHNRNSR